MNSKSSEIFDSIIKISESSDEFLNHLESHSILTLMQQILEEALHDDDSDI